MEDLSSLKRLMDEAILYLKKHPEIEQITVHDNQGNTAVVRNGMYIHA
jgi:hypothetical protein